MVVVGATSCGGEDSKPSGHATPNGKSEKRSITPASTLEGTPVRNPRENGFAGQIFWKHVRARASKVQAAALGMSASLRDPRLVSDVEQVFREATVDRSSIDEKFRRERLSVRVVDLGPQTRRRAVLKVLRVGRYTGIMRGYRVHADSPSLDVNGIKAVNDDLWERGEHPAEGFLLYSTRHPSIEDLERLRASGGAAWVVGGGSESDVDVSQVVRISSVAGHTLGETLPIPFVLLPPALERHCTESVHQSSATWQLRIERTPAAAAGNRAVVASIRGTDEKKRVVVTTRRTRTPIADAVGSECLALSVMLDIARVMAVEPSRKRRVLPTLSVDFVHVLDEGAGFDFMTEIVPDDALVMGVVEIGSVVAPPNEASLGLGTDGVLPLTLIEQAAVTAVEHARKQGGWRVGLFDVGVGIASDLAHALGQERVPLVRVFSAVDEETSYPPAPGVPERQGRLRTTPVSHPFVGTTRDRVAEIAGKELNGPIRVGRAAILSLVRAVYHPTPKDKTGGDKSAGR